MNKKTTNKKQASLGDMFKKLPEIQTPEKLIKSRVIESAPIQEKRVISPVQIKEDLKPATVEFIPYKPLDIEIPTKYEHIAAEIRMVFREGATVVLPNHDNPTDIWYCRFCKTFFPGPPITVNYDPLGRDIYIQYRCRKCFKTPSVRSFKNSMEDDMKWEIPIKEKSFICTNCKKPLFGFKYTLESDDAIIREFYCRSCKVVHDREFIGYNRDLKMIRGEAL